MRGILQKKYWRFIALAVSLLLVGLDQYFKHLAFTNLSTQPDLTIPVIPNVFHLTYVENRGAAFGMMDGKGLFLVILTGIVLIAAIVYLVLGKVKSTLLLCAVSLIIGGGIGNLVDRIFRQYVIDYLDFRIIQFAVFNFADCCVVVGTILVMAYIVFFDRKKSVEDCAVSKENVSSEIE